MSDSQEIPAASSAADITLWIERALVAISFALGLWWLLSTAQMKFYASLPVPQSAHVSELPGEGTAPAVAESGRDLTRRRVQPGEWVAKLEAPSVGLSATVIEGSTNDMLARAAGHIEDTALPGEPGNVGVAGHRDTTFRAIRDLKPGDLLRLTGSAGAYTYRIERTFIVNPQDVYVLDPTDKPALTLVTCYPFTFIGHAPKRYIVRATLLR